MSGILGLSPYAYLCVYGGETAAWGSWGEQRSLSGFFTHLLRREYGTFQLANTPATTSAEFGLRLRAFLESVPSQLPAGGLALAIAGAGHAILTKQTREIGAVLLVAYAVYALLFNYLSNLPASSAFYLQVQQRFWPQAHLLVCAGFGAGLRWVAGRLFAEQPLGLPAATVVLLAAHARAHWEAADCTGNDLVEQFGRAVLEALPAKKPVLLLTHGDEVLNSIRYVQRLLRVRPDVAVVDQNYMQFAWFVRRAGSAPEFRNVTFPGESYGTSAGAFLMHSFLDANYGRWSIFVCGGMHKADGTWEAAYQLWPLGMSSQVLRRGAHVNTHKWAARSLRLLPRLAFPRVVDGSWEQVIARNHYLAAYANRPYQVLQSAYGRPGAQDERDMFLLAARMYEETRDVALNGSVALPDHYFRNLGVAYSQLIRLEPSEEGQAGAKQQVLRAFIRYLRFDSISADDRTAIENAVLSLIPPPASAEGRPTPGAKPGAMLERGGAAGGARAAAAQALHAEERSGAVEGGGERGGVIQGPERRATTEHRAVRRKKRAKDKQ